MDLGWNSGQMSHYCDYCVCWPVTWPPCVVVSSYKGLKAAFNPQSLTITEEQMHGKGKGLDLPAGHTQLTGPSWADRGPVALASCSKSNWQGPQMGGHPEHLVLDL